MPFSEYRRKLHTILNNAALHSMDTSQFQHETEEEEMIRVKLEFEKAKRDGKINW